MQSVKSKFGILIALLLCATVIGTCTLVQHPTDTSPHPTQGNAFINQWKKEKAELQKKYEANIASLQTQNDSLQNILSKKKKVLASYRFKAEYLQTQLKEVLEKVDSSRLFPVSVMPIATNYFEAQAQSDNNCDSTIQTLEQITANRDSTIIIYQQAESNLLDLQKEQEARIQNLTEELNTTYKSQKRKIVQNKFLASALLMLSGVTTTFFINQNLK